MFRVYFVARTNRSLRPFRNSPTNFSLVPPVYRFAVSTKFPPASTYASKIFRLSSFDAPQPHSSPNVIVPRHSSETRSPVFPSSLYRIGSASFRISIYVRFPDIDDLRGAEDSDTEKTFLRPGHRNVIRSGGDAPEGGNGMTSKTRSVAEIVEPQPVIEGAGVKLRRSTATRRLNYVDPFLLFDHFGSDDPKDYLAGFPMHPHRGIDTVTYMLAGLVDHKDSEMEGFQLWVNLPARLKMSRPRYREIKADRIPEVRRPDGVRVRVVAGTADGVRGPVTEIAADPEYLDVTVPGGVEYVQPVPEGHAAIAYVFEGEGSFGGEGAQVVAATRLVVLGDGARVRVTGTGDHVRFLLLSGKPLGEPIARYGPFVMNTQKEIEQDLEDLRKGTFARRA